MSDNNSAIQVGEWVRFEGREGKVILIGRTTALIEVQVGKTRYTSSAPLNAIAPVEAQNSSPSAH